MKGGDVSREGGQGCEGVLGHVLPMALEELDEPVGLSYPFGWNPGHSPVVGGGGRGAVLN